MRRGKENDTTRVCIDCGEEKPFSEFYNINIRCKTCYEIYSKKIVKERRLYYRNNKTRLQQLRKEYDKENRDVLNKKRRERYWKEPEKFREISRRKIRCIIPIETWNKILKNQKNRCTMCKRRFTKKLKPTVDHIKPKYHGGTDTSDNIQALCRSCNSSKNCNIKPEYIQSWVVLDVTNE